MIKISKLIKLQPIFFLLLFSHFGQAAPQNARHLEELSDWIPEPASMSLCEGHYAPYILNHNAEPDNSWQLPMVLSANETELKLQGQSVLRGHVTLKQGNRYLHADEVLINRSLETQEWESLIAQGHVHYYAPGVNIWGQRAQYQQLERHFHIDNASYRWYDRHARGYADAIDIDKEANIHLFKANYTTCAPLSDTWLLSARELHLFPKKGRATAKNIRLDVNEFPIFYFPYFNYPIDKQRHSGFLFPSYGSTSNSGLQFTVPYYWNIAPNYDFHFAARWLSERGTEGQSKFRYLFPHSEGVIQWHFLPEDRKYRAFSQQNRNNPPGGLTFLDPRIIALQGNSNRSAFNYRHGTQWDKRWKFNVIFDYVSDDNYFVDLGNDIKTASTIHLPQQANLTYYGENWSHLFNIEEYQVLQPLSKPINEEIYKRQPQWVFQGIYPDQWQDLTLALNGEIVNFAHRRNIITQERVTTGDRYHLRPSVSWPLQESWYFFKPRMQMDWLHYSLSLGEDARGQDLPSQPSRTIPLYDIDAGLIYERPLHYKDYFFTQTLEPRIYYLFVPYRDQHFYPNFDSGVINFSYSQLFRDNRFSGRDRIGDANQISVSLTSRLVPQLGGQELIRASIGQIYYFEKRKVSLCEELGQENICHLFEDANAASHHSNVIGQAELHANPLWSGGLFWEWDSIHQETEQAAFNVQYHPSLQKIINMNYYWLRHDLAQTNFLTGDAGSLHQADISVFWPISLHWQFLSRWHYNLKQRQTIELLGGVEYSGCCLALQFIGSRYRQSGTYYLPQTYETYANGIFAQVVFKGLSAIPLHNPDGKLKQTIPGYIPLSERQNWLTKANQSLFPPEEIPLY